MQYICRWTLPHRYPGSLNHLQTDARTFADWGVITNYYRCRWHLHCFGAALSIHIVLIVCVSGVGSAQSNMVKEQQKDCWSALPFVSCSLLGNLISSPGGLCQTWWMPFRPCHYGGEQRSTLQEHFMMKYGPGPGFLWLTARLVMPNLEPPYVLLAVQLCTSASGLYIRFDNK